MAAAKANHAEAMVAAFADKELALKRAREAAKVDDSPTAKQKLQKSEAEIDKFHKKRVLALKKELAEEKPEEEKTEKQKAREVIEWPKNWVHGYTTQADQTAARKELKQAASAHGRGKPDEKPVWITQGSGFRGSNLFASRHAAQVKDWPEQLFKLQSKERNGEGPTKILLPEDEELFFAKPAAWVEAEEEESGEEGGEEDAEALAAARAAWIKDWASLSALAGEPRPIAAICIMLHTVA